MRHVPVLLKEVMDVFKDDEISVFVDGTLGAGGHAKSLLSNHPEISKYIGIDQDIVALQESGKNLKDFEDKIKLIKGNFESLDEILEDEKTTKVDGFLFDIGVSSMQLDDKERGFSFQKDAFLDMRMDLSLKLTAEEVVNTFSEDELEKIFREYGEEIESLKIAKKIVEIRRKKRITTTKELADIIVQTKTKKRKIHPATLVFQGLRIYVNDELNVLKKALKKAIERLNKNKKIAVITFHSLEDRIVKEIFKEASKKTHVNIYKEKQIDPILINLTKKPIKASFQELKKNPRARSAKLRVAEKK
jgi:16S rRNA (cytosine1402-N4)-methyltransferase